MANIIDYLMWRGDIKIDERFPFNEIDSMILARFSYLIFQKIDSKSNMTIKEISDKMSKFADKDFNYLGDRALIVNLGKSDRFKDMIVSNYVDKADIENEKQFRAVTIHISYDEMYVSYEGTDKTINGWKEDFNLAFQKNIPAQIEGVKYLTDVANEYYYKRIRVGGHSKGGNIAIYSALFVPEIIQNRIFRVDNFDGPGLDEKIVEENKNKSIVDRITTYMPQDSVIGRLLEHKENKIVVKSIEKGIYQHDIYSWQVLKDRPIVLSNVTDSSNRVNKAVQEWLKGTTPQQRKIFVDGICELLYENEVTSTIDLQNTLIKKAPQLIKTYKEISEEDRKIIMDNVKLFVKSYIEARKERDK